MELDITLPIPVARALSVLEACGYEGFIVGGCVRDSLLGKTPFDWDICTSADLLCSRKRKPERRKSAASCRGYLL